MQGSPGNRTGHRECVLKPRKPTGWMPVPHGFQDASQAVQRTDQCKTRPPSTMTCRNPRPEGFSASERGDSWCRRPMRPRGNPGCPARDGLTDRTRKRTGGQAAILKNARTRVSRLSVAALLWRFSDADKRLQAARDRLPADRSGGIRTRPLRLRARRSIRTAAQVPAQGLDVVDERRAADHPPGVVAGALGAERTVLDPSPAFVLSVDDAPHG